MSRARGHASFGRMRPSASPKSARPRGAADPELDVWLHFDAKYRIEHLVVDDAIEGDEEPADSDRAADDLLKMHAYRDAIRRSAGAYVLYPGHGEATTHCSSERSCRDRACSLCARLPEDQLAQTHFASSCWRCSTTLRTRSLRVVRSTGVPGTRATWSPDPPRRLPAAPPADTPTLVGYVRADQLAWVARHEAVQPAGRRSTRCGQHHRQLAFSSIARALAYGPDRPASGHRGIRAHRALDGRFGG